MSKIPKEILWEEFKEASSLILAGRKFNNQDVKYKRILKTVLRYFSTDDDFNEDGLIKNSDLNKGLLIIGNKRCVAKDVLLQIIQKAGFELREKYEIDTALFSIANASEFVYLYEFSINSKRHSFDLIKAKTKPFLIQGFGNESKAFGSYELIAEILEDRYFSKARTFITTDLSMIDISNRYGRDFSEKLRKMCNIINWD
ncbi:hypothetical protein [Tenacibaculum finnmarkense]|uniref:hypothetical protein n=1 Tax=Tenacibaculum finnmarkense TaxID=2781243 RepID=UPI00207A12A1|nr:hypothetical protein [Tenacibaculum finnmarkense]MCM8906790.1 hypothetical protein [Tenacibaculum finnmarkense genomovar finnmarkense]